MSFLSCRVRGPVLVAATLGTIAAGCGGGSEAPSATLQPTPSTTEAPPTPTTTAALTVEQEVEQAYLRALEVYARASSELDWRLLEEGFTGETLKRLIAQIDGLATADTPVRTDIQHEAIAVQLASTDEAVVYDRYLERSYRYERSTGRQVDVPNDMIIEESAVMQRMNGVWKIARIVR